MIAVLDAGAAVRAVMDPFSPFRATLEAADSVIAPELIAVEVFSVFRKYVRDGVLLRMEAEEFIDRALALVDKMEPLRDLVTDVFALAEKSDSPVYDLFYLALARRTGATLISADSVLRQAAVGMGIEVLPL